ncbi:hypothetical protein [Hansschlegelia plantiphila]|uniref:Nitrile hydratase beta subunit-like N-terminal domain-containing protein n=1 Tax=Hansschlegelia plantiphila TaxID=374655 RepID=A0A9W6J1E8_9HYPH|nr:hypothetical protein GCM10008179_12470 [Hansschlegelia plantiphila]
MNGAHDLGGMHGFGPVNPDPNEKLFNHEWERRIFAMYFATLASDIYSIDELRKNIEIMDPVHYLSSSYYEHWVESIETSLIDRKIVTKEEIAERMKKIDKEAA